MMTIHICTYIIRLFSLQAQKLSRKSFRVPFLRQGSFFKINERNISEATEFFEGSPLVDNSYLPLYYGVIFVSGPKIT